MFEQKSQRPDYYSKGEKLAESNLQHQNLLSADMPHCGKVLNIRTKKAPNLRTYSNL